MKKYYYILLIGICSCSAPKAINQYRTLPDKSKERVGYWVEKDKDEFGEYIAKGNYKDGVKTGTWKTTYQGKKYHVEKINKEGIATVKFFHPNGKVMEKGKTKMINSSSFISWEKFGEWKYYDDKGKLIKVTDYTLIKNIEPIAK